MSHHSQQHNSAHSILFDQQAQQPLFMSPQQPQASPPQQYGTGADNLQFLSSSSYNTNYGGPAGQMGTGAAHPSAYVDPSNRVFVGSPFGSGGYADEPPLLEELGINMSHIWNKSISALNVFKRPDSHIMDDADLAGPVFFCTLFGAFLLVSGKVHFGSIYGVATVGCVSMWAILNLMSEKGLDGYRTASVLGYSLLPMVILSSVSLLLSLKDAFGVTLSVTSVLWCTHSASAIFCTVLNMKDQRILVAYPIGLFYAAFALLTIF